MVAKGTEDICPRTLTSAAWSVLLKSPPFDRTAHPLMLLVGPGASMRLSITYDADRYETASMDRMLGHLARLLEQIPSDLDRPPSALSLLDEDERDLESAAAPVVVVHAATAEHVGRLAGAGTTRRFVDSDRDAASIAGQPACTPARGA